MSPKRDLTGQKFGSLTVVEDAGYKNGYKLQCRCDCGKNHVAYKYNITSGKTKSCGHCYSNSYSLSDDGSHIIMTFPNETKILIDVDDYKRVSTYTWHRTTWGYAETCVDGKPIILHRYIMNAPNKLQVDHINLDKSDNRKSNLRLATHKENKRNVGLQSNNTSGVKGVRYYKARSKYVAKIKVDGQHIHLGYYTSILEAACAYDQAAAYHFGEFAWLNNLSEKTLEVTPPVFFCCPSPNKYRGELLPYQLRDLSAR